MTAAVGLPTLRLIRTQIGPFSLMDLQLGQLSIVDSNQYAAALSIHQRAGGSGNSRSTSPAAKDFDLRNKHRNVLPMGPRGK